jgi:hypothetical protein
MGRMWRTLGRLSTALLSTMILVIGWPAVPAQAAGQVASIASASVTQTNASATITFTITNDDKQPTKLTAAGSKTKKGVIARGVLGWRHEAHEGERHDLQAEGQAVPEGDQSHGQAQEGPRRR